MGTKKKAVLKAFSYRNCDDFAAYLNHMARQGWHFMQWRGGLIFQQGAPEKSVYAVEIFDKAEESDTRPEPETEEFAEYCEAAGWKFVDAWRKFVVFKRIHPDAVPIMTDRERFDIISKIDRAVILRWLILTGIWCVLQIFDFFSGFKYSIFRSRELITTATWFLLFLLAAAETARYLIWKRKCVRRLEQGVSLFFGRDRTDRWGSWLYWGILGFQMLAFTCAGLGWIALIQLGMLAALLLLGFLIALSRPNSSVSALMASLGTVVIFLGMLTAFTYAATTDTQENLNTVNPPVVYADIWDDPGDAESVYSKRWESAFGTWNVCHLQYEDGELYYEVFRSDYDWVLDGVWREILKGRAVKEGTDCTQLWDAEIAIISTSGYYKVRYENTILDIHCDRDALTEADVAAIIEAFQLR